MRKTSRMKERVFAAFRSCFFSCTVEDMRGSSGCVPFQKEYIPSQEYLRCLLDLVLPWQRIMSCSLNFYWDVNQRWFCFKSCIDKVWWNCGIKRWSHFSFTWFGACWTLFTYLKFQTKSGPSYGQMYNVCLLIIKGINPIESWVKSADVKKRWLRCQLGFHGSLLLYFLPHSRQFKRRNLRNSIPFFSSSLSSRFHRSPKRHFTFQVFFFVQFSGVWT